MTDLLTHYAHSAEGRQGVADEPFERQSLISASYGRFLSRISSCAKADDTAWFLTDDDFRDRSDAAFAWNEFERQSLDAAEGDAEWTDQITRYWSEHLPVLLSVKSGYAYFALAERGEIVFGREPEYEEAEVVAANFDEFLAKLVVGDPTLPAGVI